MAGQVEMAAGLALVFSSFELMPPTAGGTALCTALSGGGCLPLGGAVLVVETAGVLAGTGIAAHGGAMLIRNAGNPVSRPEDPTLRYGSNTGNTTRNAQILRQNMEKAGVHAPPRYEAHHIVPSTSQNDAARQARDILEQWGIDINNADNGIFLPKSIHNGLANDHKYMNAVLEDLRQATSRDDAARILQDIGQQLLDGTYPRSGR